MDKETFWKIIDDARSSGIDPNDHAAMLNATEKELLKYPSEEIAAWHRIKRFYFDLAYRQNLWAACSATRSHDTDDGFIDFRSWLISQGREVYLRALHDPDSLADLEFSAGTADFEDFDYVAYDAYALKKAMESGDLRTNLYACCKWTVENSPKVFELCEEYGIDESQKIPKAAEAYIRALSNQYDVSKVAYEKQLSSHMKASIRADIHLGPDIGRWDYLDLPQIVPRLYEKYCAEAEQGNERGEDD